MVRTYKRRRHGAATTPSPDRKGRALDVIHAHNVNHGTEVMPVVVSATAAAHEPL